MSHTLHVLKGSGDLRSCHFGFDNDTPVAAERILTEERVEGNSPKNEMHHTPTSSSVSFSCRHSNMIKASI